MRPSLFESDENRLDFEKKNMENPIALIIHNKEWKWTTSAIAVTYFFVRTERNIIINMKC